MDTHLGLQMGGDTMGEILASSYNMALPVIAIMLIFAVFVAFRYNNVHAVTSMWKMLTGKEGTTPPVAPLGVLECIRNMTSENFPWFPLQAKKTLNADTFVLPLPLRRLVMTGDATLARAVLTDPLSMKPKTYQEFEPFGIGSIFTRNGSYWHARRKGAAPAFSNRHIKRMNQVAIEHTEKWIQEILIPCANEGKSFDVSKEMLSIALEAICETAFEYEISEQEKRDFLNNSELVMKEFLNKSINNPLRKYMGTWIPARRKALEAAKNNEKFAKKIIARYRANPNPLQGTIIDCLAKNSCYANEEELAADILLYLTAGHDTTAYTLAFTLLELARNQEEQTKVCDEICCLDSVDEWRQSAAVQMAIKESMRLFPVSASGSSRICGRDFVTKEGWSIPKGSVVVCHIMMTHRNKHVFGEDANEFVPSRWENPTQAQKDSFLIFSAGKQNCLGQALAQAELHCILPKILSHVELEVEDEGRVSWFLTLKPIGTKLRPKLRKQS